MRREHTTPIILWLGAALWLHVLLGRGGDELAAMHEGVTTLRDLASKVRRDVRGKDRPLELEALLEAKPDDPKREEEARRDDAKKPQPNEKRERESDLAKPEREKKIVEQPKPTAPVPVLPQPVDPKKRDRRIAIDQHVKPSAEDNPNANFVADEAAKVDEETVAKQTHQGEDQPDPTPGGAHVDDRVKDPGNSASDRVAQQEDVSGTKDRSPGERGSGTDLAPPPLAPPSGKGADDARGKAGTVDVARGDSSKLPPQAAATERSPRSDGDGWRFDPMAKGAQASRGTGAARDGKTGEVGKPDAPWLGLGADPGDGRPNLNLSHAAVVAVVGEDQLRRDRQNDGERRRSEHRGTWQPSSLERWRSATENYVSSVKVGNQTALNAARVPFASYLHAIHNRIHPIFADAFLGSLSGLPATHPLSDLKIQTHLEIVLSPRGEVVKMGVVRSSGVTAFDVAALDSVQRASPFGPAPPAIFSGDGNVYLHWEFHRDEVFACSTMNARPFILVSPPPIGPTKPVPTREQGPPEPLPPYAPGAERFGAVPASGSHSTLALRSPAR